MYINRDKNYLVYKGITLYENKIKNLAYERLAIFDQQEYQLAEFTSYNDSHVSICPTHARLATNCTLTHNHPTNNPRPSIQDIKIILKYKIKTLRIVTPTHPTRSLTINHMFQIDPATIARNIASGAHHTKVFSYG